MRQLTITRSITKRETVSLEKYLQEIGKIDLLTLDEEVELVKKIKKGDQVALEQLIKANLRFVVSVAKQYQNRWLPLSDLISEGNLGLMKAAKRFDETRGFRFISYAVRRIRHSILKAITTQSKMVRVPKGKKENEKLDQLPRITCESLDAHFWGENNGSTLLDMIPSPENNTVWNDALQLQYIKTMIAEALRTLPDNEAEIIKRRYGLEGFSAMKKKEIAEALGLTPHKVQYRRELALKRLRNIKELEEYL